MHDDNSAASSAGTEEAVNLSNTTEYDVPGAEFDFDDNTPTGNDPQDSADVQDDDGQATTSADASDEDDSAGDDVEDEEDEFDPEGLLGLPAEDEDNGDEGAEDEGGEDNSPLHKNPRFQQVIQQRNEERKAREELEQRLQALESERQTGAITADRNAFMDSEAERLTEALRSEDPDLEEYNPKAFDEIIATRLEKSLGKWDSEATGRAEAAKKAQTAESVVLRQAEIEKDQHALWTEEVPRFRESLTGARQGKTLLLSPIVTMDDGTTIDFASIAEGIASLQRMNGNAVSVEAVGADLEKGLQAMAKRFMDAGERKALKRLEKAENSPPAGANRGRAGQATRELSVDDVRDGWFS